MQKKYILLLAVFCSISVIFSCGKKSSPVSPVTEPTAPPADTAAATPTITMTATVMVPSGTITMTSMPDTFTRTLTPEVPTLTVTLTSTVPTGTITATNTSVILSATQTATLTVTQTVTPTNTVTLTCTYTAEQDTMTQTLTVSPTVTSTMTYTETATVTLTATPTATQTNADTQTFTRTITLTATMTSTPTITITMTATNTATPMWADFGTNPVSSDMGGMPVLRNYSSQFYLLFIDGAQGGKLSAKYHNGFNWSSIGDGISSDVAGYPSMELSSGDMYCAYAQLAKVYFKRRYLATWQSEYQISDGNAAYPDIFVYSPTSQYISYRDEYGAAAGRASLKSGQGSVWSLVGLSGFNTVAVKDTDVVVASGAVPYVACQEETGNTLGKVEVMTYNGASWSQAGTTITARTGCNIDMVYGGGYIYLAYAAPQSPYPVQVIRYSGGSWTPVGGIFHNVEAKDISLSYDVYTATLSVAYTNVSASNSGEVYSWNGTSWSQTGSIFNNNISTSSALFPSLNVYNGVPYVAFKDDGSMYGGKIMVRNYR